jgi:hypothetical protein
MTTVGRIAHFFIEFLSSKKLLALFLKGVFNKTSSYLIIKVPLGSSIGYGELGCEGDNVGGSFL